MMKLTTNLQANKLATLLLVAILLSSSAGIPANATSATIQTPDELVRQFYKHDSAIVVRGTTDDDKRVKVYFDKPLADLILTDHHADDSDQLSFDPIFDTNGGIEMTDLQVGAPKYTGDNATVLVTFTLKESGFRKKITYSLHKTPQGWRIADLNTNEWDLKQTLSHLHPKGK
jgi:hypothetical protein